MNLRLLGRRAQEVTVVVAAVAVAAYTGWVIHAFRSTTEVTATQRANTTVTPAQTPSPTSERAPKRKLKQPPSLEPFVRAVGTASNILVVGDSTGDEPDEWVYLWAKDATRNRDQRITVQQWDPVASEFNAFHYGNGDRELTIWNLSYRASEADYATKLRELKIKPDAIILNVGHDRDPAALDQITGQLGKAVDRRWGKVPTAWTLQNPSTGAAAREQENAVRYLRSQAARTQVPVIDVHAAFADQRDLGSLLLDGARPNARGSALWTKAVERAIHLPGAAG